MLSLQHCNSKKSPPPLDKPSIIHYLCNSGTVLARVVPSTAMPSPCAERGFLLRQSRNSRDRVVLLGLLFGPAVFQADGAVEVSLALKPLYLMSFLHQTTTRAGNRYIEQSCISCHSYIKPQPCPPWPASCRRCISCHSYIKPQRCRYCQK